MARRPVIATVRANFLLEIEKAKRMNAAFEALPRKVNPSVAIGIHPKYVQKSRELAFLGVVSAWEEFLEQTLVRYLMGAQSSNGYAPTLRGNKALSISEAFRELAQNQQYHPARSYLNSGQPGWGIDQANRLFSAHSYQCIQNRIDLLRKAVDIRNRVAHRSRKSRTLFENAARWFLCPASGVLSQSFSPGALLGMPVQRHFGNTVSQTGSTHFEAYLDLYKSLAISIAP